MEHACPGCGTKHAGDFDHCEQCRARMSKRPYEKPMLIEFGSVRELTRGSGSRNTDSVPHGTRHH